MRIIDVAIAVIHYQRHYLLAHRDQSQHQGDRYEFVGGKVALGETVASALIREVSEELGVTLNHCQLIKLGRIEHDYGDRLVRLTVFDVSLTLKQFKLLSDCDYGCEGQPLSWVEQSQLIAGYYRLPAANLPILSWLQMPQNVTITFPLSQFQNHPSPLHDWADFHSKALAERSTVLIRPKAITMTANQACCSDESLAMRQLELTITAVTNLLSKRADIQVILPDLLEIYNKAEIKPTWLQSQRQAIDALILRLKPFYTNNQIYAQHLTHSTVVRLAGDISSEEQRLINLVDGLGWSLTPSLPIVVSCHDNQSIQAANQLAAHRIEHQQAPVIAVFISPVQATKSHPKAEPIGWSSFSKLANVANMPSIALGGLRPEDTLYAQQFGAAGVAGIRRFMAGN